MKKWTHFIFGPSLNDLYLFFLKLQTYYAAGVAPLTAINGLIDQTENKLFKEDLKKIARELGEGVPLAEAFKKHGQFFSKECPNIIEAGEQSSSLDVCLEDIAAYLEQVQAVRRKITSAVLPVAISMAVMFCTVFLLMVYAMPSIVELFHDTGAEVPALTMFMIEAFSFLIHYWYVFTGIGVLVLIGLYQYYEKHPEVVDWILMHIPFYRTIHHKLLQYNFMKVFVLLIKSGIASKEAIELTAKTSGNGSLAKMLNRTVLTMREGVPLAQALKKNNKGKILDSMIIHLIETGEPLGKMEYVLNKATNTYQQELRKLTDDLGSKIIPFFVLPTYMIIIGIVLSVMYPVLNLGV